MKKRGISFIVLIVTIIVVIILAAVVILTLSKNNLIESANEATFKQDIRAYQDELNMYISKECQQLAGQRDHKITATGYEKNSTSGEYNNSVYKYLNSFKKKYDNKIAIENDEIIYTGINQKERKYANELNIKTAKILTINYLDGEGNTIKNKEARTLVGLANTYKAPDIENYMSIVEEVTIDENVDEITFPYRRDELFQGVNSLREVLVNDGNTKYKSENGILYRIEDNAIIIDPNNL